MERVPLPSSIVDMQYRPVYKVQDCESVALSHVEDPHSTQPNNAGEWRIIVNED